MSTNTSQATDGLPKQFVDSMKVLFTILDEKCAGSISLTDIEDRWHQENVPGLPDGVIKALEKVALPSGQLTFERFVAGLKIALLRSRAGNQNVQANHDIDKERGVEETQSQRSNFEMSNNYVSFGKTSGIDSMQIRPEDKEVAEIFKPSSSKGSYSVIFPNENRKSHSMTNMATVKPMNQRYTQSLSELESTQSGISNSNHAQLTRKHSIHQDVSSHEPEQSFSWDLSNQAIVNQRKGWRSDQAALGRGLADGRASIASTSALDLLVKTAALPKASQDDMTGLGGKRLHRRRDSRRHTLASGIDYNMIKRIKQLEEEKDVLCQGLDVCEMMKGWYQNQLIVVQERKRMVGQGAVLNDNSIEANQERMNFQKARIEELNQQMKILIESTEKGYPMHMNLAMSRPPVRTSSPTEQENVIAMLKAQNKMLTKELGHKSEHLSRIEREKATLIQQVFMARSSNKPHHNDDTTFL